LKRPLAARSLQRQKVAPPWGRGLKRDGYSGCSCHSNVAPPWGRGLKLKGHPLQRVLRPRRPPVGAWIETPKTKLDTAYALVAPPWGRGLKRSELGWCVDAVGSPPRGGVD